MDIYDNHGNKIGGIHDSSGGCFLIIIAGFGLIIAVLKTLENFWNLLASYETHSSPYNFVAGFYYFLLAVLAAPISSASHWYGIIIDNNISPYVNLNKVGALLAWLVVAVTPYILIYVGLTRTKLSEKRLIILALLSCPAAIGLLWYLTTSFYIWISATGTAA